MISAVLTKDTSHIKCCLTHLTRNATLYFWMLVQPSFKSAKFEKMNTLALKCQQLQNGYHLEICIVLQCLASYWCVDACLQSSKNVESTVFAIAP